MVEEIKSSKVTTETTVAQFNDTLVKIDNDFKQLKCRSIAEVVSPTTARPSPPIMDPYCAKKPVYGFSSTESLRSSKSLTQENPVEDSIPSKEYITQLIARVRVKNLSFASFPDKLRCPIEVVPSFQKVANTSGFDQILEVFESKQD